MLVSWTHPSAEWHLTTSISPSSSPLADEALPVNAENDNEDEDLSLAIDTIEQLDKQSEKKRNGLLLNRQVEFGDDGFWL